MADKPSRSEIRYMQQIRGEVPKNESENRRAVEYIDSLSPPDGWRIRCCSSCGLPVEHCPGCKARAVGVDVVRREERTRLGADLARLRAENERMRKQIESCEFCSRRTPPLRGQDG